jgi:tetratricopeptide (TPR) repeat protein
MRKFSLIFALAILLIPSAQVHAEKDPGSLYLESIKLFRAGQYEQARERFAEILTGYPDSRFAQDAAFKIGESYYRQGSFEKAGGYFRLYLEHFSTGKNCRDAKTRLDQCEKKVGREILAANPLMKNRSGPLRLVQVNRFADPNYKALERRLAAWSAQGVNAVIVPGFHLGESTRHAFLAADIPAGPYFRTGSTRTEGSEVVDRLATIAHKYGIELILEFPARALPLEPRDRKWHPVKKVFTEGDGPDFFSVEVQSKLATYVTEAVAGPVDGIYFSELSLIPIEGFSENALAAYKEATIPNNEPGSLFENAEISPLGILSFDPAEGYENVALIKQRQIATLASTLAETARKRNPNFKVFTEVARQAITDPADGLLWHSQSVEDLVNPPFSGVIFRVNLHRDQSGAPLTEKGRSDSIARLLNAAASLTGSPAQVQVILEVIDSVTKKPLPEHYVSTAIGPNAGSKPFGIGLFDIPPGYDIKTALSPGIVPGATQEQGAVE